MGGRVIVVANQKGGVGKTATAIQLACYARELGLRVKLVDTDAQKAGTDFVYQNRANANDAPHVEWVHLKSNAASQIRMAQEVYDLVIVDTPSNNLLSEYGATQTPNVHAENPQPVIRGREHFNPSMLEVLSCADLIVVPSRAPGDGSDQYSTDNILEAKRDIPSIAAKPMTVVFCFCHYKCNIEKLKSGVEEAWKSIGVRIASRFIPDIKRFKQAQGRAINLFTAKNGKDQPYVDALGSLFEEILQQCGVPLTKRTEKSA